MCAKFFVLDVGVSDRLCLIIHRVSKNTLLLFFYDNFGKNGPVFIIISLLKLGKKLWKKLELEQPPPLKSVDALPCEN